MSVLQGGDESGSPTALRRPDASGKASWNPPDRKRQARGWPLRRGARIGRRAGGRAAAGIRAASGGGDERSWGARENPKSLSDCFSAPEGTKKKTFSESLFGRRKNGIAARGARPRKGGPPPAEAPARTAPKNPALIRRAEGRFCPMIKDSFRRIGSDPDSPEVAGSGERGGESKEFNVSKL